MHECRIPCFNLRYAIICLNICPTGYRTGLDVRYTSSGLLCCSDVLFIVCYSRTRIKETRIKETFGYKKRFHSSDFMQVKLSTLIGQLIKETMDKRNPFLTAQ